MTTIDLTTPLVEPDFDIPAVDLYRDIHKGIRADNAHYAGVMVGNRILGVEVIPPEQLPSVRRVPIVASVAGLEPRRQIRDALNAMGFRELDDFICAA